MVWHRSTKKLSVSGGLRCKYLPNKPATSIRVQRRPGGRRLTHVEVVLVWIVQNFDELDDVRVIELLEDCDFTVDALERVLYPRLAAEPRRQLLCTSAIHPVLPTDTVTVAYTQDFILGHKFH